MAKRSYEPLRRGADWRGDGKARNRKAALCAAMHWQSRDTTGNGIASRRRDWRGNGRAAWRADPRSKAMERNRNANLRAAMEGQRFAGRRRAQLAMHWRSGEKSRMAERWRRQALYRNGNVHQRIPLLWIRNGLISVATEQKSEAKHCVGKAASRFVATCSATESPGVAPRGDGVAKISIATISNERPESQWWGSALPRKGKAWIRSDMPRHCMARIGIETRSILRPTLFLQKEDSKCTST